MRMWSGGQTLETGTPAPDEVWRYDQTGQPRSKPELPGRLICGYGRGASGVEIGQSLQREARILAVNHRLVAVNEFSWHDSRGPLLTPPTRHVRDLATVSSSVHGIGKVISRLADRKLDVNAHPLRLRQERQLRHLHPSRNSHARSNPIREPSRMSPNGAASLVAGRLAKPRRPVHPRIGRARTRSH